MIKIIKIAAITIILISGTYLGISFWREREQKQQLLDSLDYSAAMKQTVEAKPFLRYLPIQTPEFTIIYDSSKKQILVIAEDGASREEIKTSLKQIGAEDEAITWLKTQ